MLKANPAGFTLPFVCQLMEEFGTYKLRKQKLRWDLIAIHKYTERGKGEAKEKKQLTKLKDYVGTWTSGKNWP